jgi:hypothetical protein
MSADTDEFLIVHRFRDDPEFEEYDNPDPDQVVGLACGSCGSSDIREHDRADRWNDIEIYDGKLSVSQQDAEFHTVGFLCCDCGKDLIVNGPDVDVFELLTYL